MQIRSAPIVQELASARRVTRGWVAYLVFLGCVFGVQATAIAVLPGFWPVVDGSPAAQVQEGVINLLTTLALFVWVLLYERRGIVTLGFRRPGRGVLTLLLGVPVGAALISVPILVLWATGSYVQVEAPPSAATGFSAVPLLVALSMTWVLQGGNEEVLMRGYLLPNQAWKLPTWPAILIPALVFTLMHGVLSEPIAFVTLMAYAAFASFVVLRTGSLWLVIGIHGGWNWALGNLFAIPVSGLPTKTSSLVYLETAPGAPDWLTGGAFGTEGGLAAMVWIVAAAVVAYLLLRRHAATWPEPVAAEPAADRT